MFHIGIDIGGTFTDCVLIGETTDGDAMTYGTAKALSTRQNPADGVLAGLTELAASAGLTLPELLGRTTRLGHGTTIGTNAATAALAWPSSRATTTWPATSMR